MASLRYPLNHHLFAGALLLGVAACGSSEPADVDAAPAAVDAGPDASPPADAGPDAAPDASVRPSTLTDLCHQAPEIVPGVRVLGETQLPSLINNTDGDACFGAIGGEVAFHYTLDHQATLVFTASARHFDVVAYIRHGCDVPDDACQDDENTDGETVMLRDAAPGEYYFFVDGFADTDVGSFSADLELR